jgi:hypothetical protein
MDNLPEYFAQYKKRYRDSKKKQLSPFKQYQYFLNK